MNVLVFTTLYPNNIWHRQGIYVKERMISFAARTGNKVKVVAPVPYFPPLKITDRWRYSQVCRTEVRDGVDVYHPRYFITPKVGMVLYGWMMFLSVVPTILKIQRTFNFDVIDAHFVYPDGFAAVLLGRVLRKPVVVSARGSDLMRYSRLPLIRPLLRQTLKGASRAIAVSRELKETMLRLGIAAEKVAVVLNGVDFSRFHRVPQAEARHTLGLPNKKTILSVGNLIHGKGFDRLLKAFTTLVAMPGNSDLFLVIAGDGPYRKDLQDMISTFDLRDKVRLAGDVYHQDLHLWYNAADLFCLLSRQEGCPNVVLEALACGVPVVATPVGEIPTLLPTKEVGLLTEPEEDAIVHTLSVALQKPWQPDEIINHAKRYTWEGVADSVSRVFTAALEDSMKKR